MLRARASGKDWLAVLSMLAMSCSLVTGLGGAATPPPGALPGGSSGQNLTATATPFAGSFATPLGASPNDPHWSGTIHTVSSYVSQAPIPGGGGVVTAGCSNEKVDSTFHAYVAHDGTVYGSGLALFVGMPQCTIDQKNMEKNEATQALFSVSGTFDGRQFRLHFPETELDGGTGGLTNYSLLDVDGSAPDIVVPLTGKTTALGITDMKFSPRLTPTTTITAEHQVDMQCLNCGLP